MLFQEMKPTYLPSVDSTGVKVKEFFLRLGKEFFLPYGKEFFQA